MNTVAKNIKKLREEAHLSQQGLAERIIVTRQTVSNWERGLSQPDIELLSQIAAALNIEVTELIFDESLSEQKSEKLNPARVKTVIILGVLWIIALLLFLFLLPALERCRWDFDVYPYWIGYCTISPALYGLGGALVFALISLWDSICFQSRLLRASLLVIGFAVILLYPTLLFCTHWTAFHIWLWEHPVLFVVPGSLLFCGFSWTRPSHKPNVSKSNDPELKDHSMESFV